MTVCHVCAYVRMKDTKTEFCVLGRRRKYMCKLVLCFSYSFASMAIGFIGHFKQGYTSSSIIVSWLQTVFQKFVSSGIIRANFVSQRYQNKTGENIDGFQPIRMCSSCSLGDCFFSFSTHSHLKAPKTCPRPSCVKGQG